MGALAGMGCPPKSRRKVGVWLPVIIFPVTFSGIRCFRGCMNGAEPNSNPNMPAKCPQCGAALPSGALEGLCPACLLQQGAAAETAQPDSVPFQPPSVAEVARLFPQLEVLAFIG